MADPKSRELTLYVQSKKVVTSFYRPPTTSPTTQPETAYTQAAPTGYTRRAEEDASEAIAASYFLSDDQARCVAHCEDIAANRGYKVHVEDVGRAGRVEQFVMEHLRGVEKFPVLVSPTGLRLEGIDAFSDEALCELMPTEIKGIRAFTYIKVRGGDLDRIRDLLLGLREVKEMHLLTGDWDIFAVLDFSAEGAKKRQVLDFVTEKIRGIPDVLDTSTLVPEVSTTKFPLPP